MENKNIKARHHPFKWFQVVLFALPSHSDASVSWRAGADSSALTSSFLPFQLSGKGLKSLPFCLQASWIDCSFLPSCRWEVILRVFHQGSVGHTLRCFSFKTVAVHKMTWTCTRFPPFCYSCIKQSILKWWTEDSLKTKSSFLHLQFWMVNI